MNERDNYTFKTLEELSEIIKNFRGLLKLSPIFKQHILLLGGSKMKDKNSD
mgnify:CR=1 FL=1